MYKEHIFDLVPDIHPPTNFDYLSLVSTRVSCEICVIGAKGVCYSLLDLVQSKPNEPDRPGIANLAHFLANSSLNNPFTTFRSEIDFEGMEDLSEGVQNMTTEEFDSLLQLELASKGG